MYYGKEREEGLEEGLNGSGKEGCQCHIEVGTEHSSTAGNWGPGVYMRPEASAPTTAGGVACRKFGKEGCAAGVGWAAGKGAAETVSGIPHQ